MKRLNVVLLSIAILGAIFLITRVRRSPTVAQSSDILVVGTNSDYPPFTFIKDRTLTGFDIDLIKEIAERMHKQIDFKDMAFTNLIPELERGSIQIVAAGVTPTPERAKKIIFAKSHITQDPFVIVTMLPNKAHSLHDLEGKEVVVNEGYSAESFMNNWGKAHLNRLTTPADAFLALKSGRAFAYVDAKTPVTPFFEQYGHDLFNMTPLEDTEQEIALAISPKYPHLKIAIEDALNAIEQDGTLKALKSKWGLS